MTGHDSEASGLPFAGVFPVWNKLLFNSERKTEPEDAQVAELAWRHVGSADSGGGVYRVLVVVVVTATDMSPEHINWVWASGITWTSSFRSHHSSSKIVATLPSSSDGGICC